MQAFLSSDLCVMLLPLHRRSFLLLLCSNSYTSLKSQSKLPSLSLTLTLTSRQDELLWSYFALFNHIWHLYDILLFSRSVTTNSFATLWTVACQAPLSMGFSRQEYCSELPFPPPGDLPNPGIEPTSPALQANSLPLSHWGSYSAYLSPDPEVPADCDLPQERAMSMKMKGLKETSICPTENTQ